MLLFCRGQERPKLGYNMVTLAGEGSSRDWFDVSLYEVLHVNTFHK